MIPSDAASAGPVRTEATVVTIPADRITDEDSFHDVFAEVMGFPAFYGRNMHAWIDCMSYADDAESEMTSITVAPGQVLALRIDQAPAFAQRCPWEFKELQECAAFVNCRRTDNGKPPLLALMFSGSFPD